MQNNTSGVWQSSIDEPQENTVTMSQTENMENNKMSLEKEEGMDIDFRKVIDPLARANEEDEKHSVGEQFEKVKMSVIQKVEGVKSSIVEKAVEVQNNLDHMLHKDKVKDAEKTIDTEVEEDARVESQPKKKTVGEQLETVRTTVAEKAGSVKTTIVEKAGGVRKSIDHMLHKDNVEPREIPNNEFGDEEPERKRSVGESFQCVKSTVVESAGGVKKAIVGKAGEVQKSIDHMLHKEKVEATTTDEKTDKSEKTSPKGNTIGVACTWIVHKVDDLVERIQVHDKKHEESGEEAKRLSHDLVEILPDESHVEGQKACEKVTFQEKVEQARTDDSDI